jgi:Tol biopolymer transport system component
VGLAAGFVAAYAVFRAPTTPARISVIPMSFRTECIFNARFAADGATVVFSAAREGNLPELFVHRPDYPAPQPLGRQDTHLLAISSKGELAVLTGARFVAHFIFNGTLARMDMSGGAPRNVAQNIQEADWSPDGESLAIIREVNGQSRLEYPIGNVLFETAGYLSDMRLSPHGDQIAFFEHPFRYDERGSVDVLDLKGGKRILSDGYSGMEGLTWSNDGDSIYFGGAANGDTNYLIFAVTLSGKTRTVLASTENLWPYDRDKKGNLLATGNSYQEIVNALAPGATAERDVSWLGSSGSPNLSPDGKQILFTENSASTNSNYSLLLGGTDGSPVARLGEGAALGISPDGQWALSLVPGPPSQIVLNAIGSGEKRVLPRGGIETYALAGYFPDGKRVLVCGNEAGHRMRCYVQDIAGGSPRPITPEGTGGGLVSPDGKSVLAQDSDRKYFIYPVAGGSPVLVSWIGPDETVAQWTPDGGAILVFHQKDIPSRVEKIDMATGHRTLVRILAPADRAGTLEIPAVSFSADEKAYAYSYVKNVSRLALIEGVK